MDTLRDDVKPALADTDPAAQRHFGFKCASDVALMFSDAEFAGAHVPRAGSRPRVQHQSSDLEKMVGK